MLTKAPREAHKEEVPLHRRDLPVGSSLLEEQSCSSQGSRGGSRQVPVVRDPGRITVGERGVEPGLSGNIYCHPGGTGPSESVLDSQPQQGSPSKGLIWAGHGGKKRGDILLVAPSGLRECGGRV